jgi:hypothetical protein
VAGVWGQARAALEVGRVSLEGAVGKYPNDLTGFTNGVYAWTGLRIPLRKNAKRRPKSPFSVIRLDPQTVRATVSFEKAARLEIVGDWNGWVPEAFSRSGSVWTIDLILPVGAHKFAVVVDGDRWVVPEGVLTVADDFGEVLGLLLVPGQSEAQTSR